MDTLRSPGGCPWDARQTHASLVEYLIEEAYETVEAIETDDAVALREELGDVLLQVVFHARIAEESEATPFSIDDVAQGIVDKLVRRHPHVFGDQRVDSAEHVEARWQEMKAAEKGRESVTDGVPEALPALLLAAKLTRRARTGGVEVPVGTDAQHAAAQRALEQMGPEGLGGFLLALVESADRAGIDAEAALRDAVRQQRVAIRASEGLGAGDRG